jgi:uncharacterized alpha-E superfamily protein
MIAELPQDQPRAQTSEEGILICEVLAELSGADLKQLTQLSKDDYCYPLLEELLTGQKERIEKLSEALTQRYFSPTLVPQRLGAVAHWKKS